MHVIIPDDYQDAVGSLDCFARLHGHRVTVFHDTVTGTDALAERLKDAEALVLIRERTPIDSALLERLPGLRFISQTGRGTTHIDLEACARCGVVVSAGSGSPYAPAELTIALILAAMRKLPQEIASLRNGGWQTTLGTTVRGRKLGILGYGKIGALVAGFGRALGMVPLAFGREGSLQRAQRDGVQIVASVKDLFASSDVLSLHLRLTNETRGVVTAQHLALMKETALLVNTARAELIELGALVDALRAGRPGFAAVDVYEEEPIVGSAHPLLALPNALCTPHLGYVERDSYEMYFGEAFDQVLAYAAGTPINVVT